MSEIDKTRWYRNPVTKDWSHGDPSDLIPATPWEIESNLYELTKELRELKHRVKILEEKK